MAKKAKTLKSRKSVTLAPSMSNTRKAYARKAKASKKEAQMALSKTRKTQTARNAK